MDLYRLVAEQLGDDHAADVQPHRLEDELADGAVLDQQPRLAIRRAEQRGDRIAGGRQLGRAIDFADAGPHRFEIGEQLLDLQPACRHVDGRAHRRALAVQLQVRSQRAAGHAEVQRLQVQHAVLQHDMGLQIVDRQIDVADDALAREAYVGVDIVPAFGAERRHRQRLVGRLAYRAARRGLARLGVGANQRRQVLEAQLLRHQLAGKQRARIALRIGQRAAEVAAADPAAEVLIAVDRRALAQRRGQAAVGAIRRGLGQHHAGQWVQVRHALAGQLQHQVQRGEPGRLGQRALDLRAGAADAHIGLQRVGPAGVAQVQHRAGPAVGVDRGLVVMADRAPADAVDRFALAVGPGGGGRSGRSRGRPAGAARGWRRSGRDGRGCG